jgi:predicted RNA methylase
MLRCFVVSNKVIGNGMENLGLGNLGVSVRVFTVASEFTSFRWIYDNKEFVANKKILELGAGLGLCGIICSLYSNQVVMSDYTPEVVPL